MEKMTPQEYRSILDDIELQSLYLKKLDSYILHDQIGEGMSVVIKDNSTYSNTDEGFIAESRYTLNAKNQQKKIVLKIDCVYAIIFESSKNITDPFFEIYKDMSLPLNVWPFFREMVNSITSRMNIPPLTLPLIKR